jgi:hypothetical protein
MTSAAKMKTKLKSNKAATSSQVTSNTNKKPNDRRRLLTKKERHRKTKHHRNSKKLSPPSVTSFRLASFNAEATSTVTNPVMATSPTLNSEPCLPHVKSSHKFADDLVPSTSNLLVMVANSASGTKRKRCSRPSFVLTKVIKTIKMKNNAENFVMSVQFGILSTWSLMKYSI